MNLSKVALLLAGLWGGANATQLSNRNGFVDGAMAYWNPSAASPVALPTNLGSYPGPVMWRVSAGTGGAGTVALVNLQTSTDLAAMEAEDTISCFKIAITGGSSGTVAARTAGAFFQPLENVARYAGKSVTIQFKLKADAPITIPSILASQNFGTGGAPSAQVVLDKAITWNVGTSFKKFSVRLDFPNLVGKTLGGNGDSGLSVGFWLPPGVTTTGLYVAEAQIEACSPNASSDLTGLGGNPLSFEHRGPQAEAARSHRFFFAPGGAQLNVSGYGSGSAYTAYHLPVVMRAIPAVSASWGSGVNANAGSFRVADYKTIESNITNTGSVGFSAVVTWTAFDARL
ncbi:hypothetical protein SB861_37810 [Paraburkholderia sp. SIMBA_049]